MTRNRQFLPNECRLGNGSLELLLKGISTRVETPEECEIISRESVFPDLESR